MTAHIDLAVAGGEVRPAKLAIPIAKLAIPILFFAVVLSKAEYPSAALEKPERVAVNRVRCPLRRAL
jgi:hypothetical protein